MRHATTLLPLLLSAAISLPSCAPKPHPIRPSSPAPRPAKTIFMVVDEIKAQQAADQQQFENGELTREEFLKRSQARMARLDGMEAGLRYSMADEQNQRLIRAIEGPRTGY